MKTKALFISFSVLLAALFFGVFSVSSASTAEVPISETTPFTHSIDRQSYNAPITATPHITVLQVYPDGHNTTAIAEAVNQWSAMFHIDVLPVSSFNTCDSVTCTVVVLDPLTNETATHTVEYYDVLLFGVADSYGEYDLNPGSAEIVREFAGLGKGLVFTHDTIAKSVNDGHILNPNFASLIDVHGIGLAEGCTLLTYTKVKLISEEVSNPVLNSPFRFPSSFDTLGTHWGCQTIVSGTAWYHGTDSSLSADYNLYMQTYFNEDYGSRSAFYSYGHTEDVPLEWEAKAMINSMYFAHRGDGPALDLPVEYASYTNFATAAQGNIGDTGPGRVNSWYDHSFPTYGVNGNLTRWNGHIFTFTAELPSKIGESWYDGHNGIDFENRLSNEPIYAAATGRVTKTVSNCTEGITTCGGYLGNQVWIDHGAGYATVYGHLKTVSVTKDTEITSVVSQPIGIMGNTGNSDGIHLHFGVYKDTNNDGQWFNEALDPFGWLGSGPDPWDGATSIYLWKYSLWTQQIIGSPGGIITSPSGNIQVFIPAGALMSEITLELWDTPPTAESSAQLHFTGRALWMRALEGLTESGANRSLSPVQTSFVQPVTITVAYSDREIQHLQEDTLAVYHWDEDQKVWSELATIVHPDQNYVSAQTVDTGHFALQAPLVCLDDASEPDDSYYTAAAIATDGLPANGRFDTATDEDWFRLETTAGKWYTVQTLNLATEVNTVIEVYDLDGITYLISDDNSGDDLASKLTWQAPRDGTHFIRIYGTDTDVYGCEATYQVSITEIPQIYLPLVLRH